MSDDSSRASRSRAAKRIAFLLVTAVSAQFCRAAESAPQELSPQEEQAALWKAETTGFAIYKHDHAAAVATDALFALGVLKCACLY